MTKAQVLRFEVPPDDRPHEFPLSGPILHVAAWTPYVVKFWAVVTPTGDPLPPVSIQAFGTGQALPEGAEYIGTAVVLPRLAWHLFRVPGGESR